MFGKTQRGFAVRPIRFRDDQYKRFEEQLAGTTDEEALRRPVIVISTGIGNVFELPEIRRDSQIGLGDYLDDEATAVTAAIPSDGLRYRRSVTLEPLELEDVMRRLPDFDGL